MRVLVFTQHFVPEVTAGRFRIEAFVRALAARGHEVEVIAPVPNHPEGVVQPEYRGRILVRERVGGCDAKYIWTYTSPRKTTVRRLAFYGSYFAAGALAGAAARRADVVLATSPPLSVPAAAAAVARVHRAPWVFDVRDLWPLAAEVIGEISNPRVIAAAEGLERRLYRDADAIVAVTQAFVRHISDRVDDHAKIELIRNGATEAWLSPAGAPNREEVGLPSDRFVWAYAGNLGPSRRLDIAIEAAERLGDGFQLLIVGDGGARADLEALASALPAGRVRFTGLLESSEAAGMLRAADALFVPQRAGLGDFVPSKLFDYAAIGKPLVVMADGETIDLARESGAALTLAPEDVDGLTASLRRLGADAGLCRELGSMGRSFAEEHSRSKQSERMVDLLEARAEGSG